MKIFVSGGCKNGKSTYSEKMAVLMKKPEASLYYIATMLPVDKEDEVRIERHINSRAHYNFQTFEVSNNIDEITEICQNNGSFLIDSLTALLANEMFKDGKIHTTASEKISTDLKKIFDKIEDIVIVSDYIYSDANLYDEYTDIYKKSLAYLDRVCAENCDVVIEVCFGNLILHKGKELFGDLYDKLD